MIIKRFFDEQLAQASYLVGCGKTGEAIVIDPPRNFEEIEGEAAKEGVRITGVTETHIHADYLSGARELAHKTGAKLYLSKEGTEDWQYQYADEPNVQLVGEGDSIRVGNVRLDVVHTPGHTPEHIAFVLTDEPASSEPCGVFSGDFIFAGDVGRPDLLERAAGIEGTMAESAKTLYATIQRFLAKYPEYLAVWPGHGAGSSCGKSLGAVPSTTLGYEKRANWALRASSESEFVETVLSGQPEPPRYFKEMKRLNKTGPDFLNGSTAPLHRAAPDSLLLDIRPVTAVAKGLRTDAISIPYGKGFAGYAGSIIPFGSKITLIADSETDAVAAKRTLESMGYDGVLGWVGEDANASAQVENLDRKSPAQAREMIEQGAFIVDVRKAAEVAEGALPGSHHIPLGSLPDRLNQIPQDRPVLLHCASGFRSGIALSILRKAGFRNAVNGGGYEALAQEMAVPAT